MTEEIGSEGRGGRQNAVLPLKYLVDKGVLLLKKKYFIIT